MPWYQKKIISGKVIEIYRYFSVRKTGKKYLPRTINRNTTPEEKQVINDREARLKCARILNANFSKEDVFVRLSYRKKPASEQQAIQDNRNFRRRLSYFIKKNDLPELKFMTVTEKGTGRVHHHWVMNFKDLSALINIWGLGGVYCVPLWSEDFTNLANYITKETIRNEHGKRWSQSRNLKQPEIKVVELKKESQTFPKTPKGYTLIECTCYTTSLGHKTWYTKTVENGAEYLETG